VVTRIQQKLLVFYSPPRLRELRTLRGFLWIAQPPSSKGKKLGSTDHLADQITAEDIA